MKLAEFKKESPPGDAGSQASSAETGTGGEEYTTSTTPSGIEVYYSWAPRRHYKLRQRHMDCDPEQSWQTEWIEVPSVTQVLGVLDKSGPLTYWGMKVGIEGVMKLIENDDLLYRGHREPHCLITTEPAQATVQDIVDLMVHRKLTVNHVKDSAADRGVNVHGALEAWANGVPDDREYTEAEAGYVEGLHQFIIAAQYAVDGIEAELMVGSLEHQYAGRFDLVLTLSKPVEVVTRHYPVKKDKVEEIPAGRWIVDLKTSKRCYPTHALQLAAYRQAMVECGYPDVDHMAVLHVTDDGGYEFCPALATLDEFLAVKSAYDAMERKDWFAKSVLDLLPPNEREVVKALKDEFGVSV